MSVDVSYSDLYYVADGAWWQLLIFVCSVDISFTFLLVIVQSTSRDHPPAAIQSSLYTLLTVLPSYLTTRLKDLMLEKGWADYPPPRSYLSLLVPTRQPPQERGSQDDVERKRKRRRRELQRFLWDLMESIEKISTLLFSSRYRTLVDRVLGMRLVYTQKSFGRNVSYEFLNRQLVWEAFTDFVLFLLPLIKPLRLQLRLSRLLTYLRRGLVDFAVKPFSLIRSNLSSSESPNDTDQDVSSTRPKEGLLASLPPMTCPICFTESTAMSLAMQQGNINTSTGQLSSDPTDPSNSVVGLAHLQLVGGIGGSGGDVTMGEVGGNNLVKIPYVTDCGKWDEETSTTKVDSPIDDNVSGAGPKLGASTKEADHHRFAGSSPAEQEHGCLYCYFCVSKALLAWEESGNTGGWPCLRCGREVWGAKRWDGGQDGLETS